jgi:hypothetical protein
MERVDRGSNPTWSLLMLDLVRLTAQQQRFFTAEDVFERLDEIPDAPITPNKRAFGPVMMRALRNGYCRKTGRSKNTYRASMHACPIAIWESLLCEH